MKKAFIFLFILFSLVIAAWTISSSRSFQFFGQIVSSVETSQNIVALTFDDGPWNTKYTNQVIKILDELDVKATFFLNGKGIEKNPQAAENLVANGYEIGNHAYSHKRLVLKSLGEVKREVDSTTKLIREAGYTGEIYFRPPYGKKLFTLPYYLSQQKMVSVTWDVEPESHKEVNVSADSISDYVLGKTKPGSIILLHVLGSKNQMSRDSIARIVEGLRSKGFQFVTVSELLESNGY